ncbi:hypothetical protein ESCO_003866 [Escovopsis weberi]|uniref:Uncharacterized protein n=1 Tax=Escovopsis weberi TaxID=150374 RepID=A0A0M8N8V0_ESCWE|nr:hypothetical protein ESCO_003866 [Escovopsis weberi]
MPRAAAGQDFLASLDELFQEAHSHDPAGTNSFSLTAKQLVALLAAAAAASDTTAARARARANWPVKLPDGSEPNTVIQPPPAALKLDMPLALRLGDAADPADFLAVLGRALEDLGDDGGSSSSSSSRKRGNGLAAGATPRKRIVLRGAGLTPGCRYAEKPATPVSQVSAPGRLPSPPATNAKANANAVVRMDIGRDDSAVMSPSAFIRRATRGIVPRVEADIVASDDDDDDDVCEIAAPGPSPAAVIEVVSDEDDSITDHDDDDDDDDIVDLDSDLEMQDVTGVGMHAGLSIRALQGTCTPRSHRPDGSNPKPRAQPAETLKHIIDDVCNTTPEEWEAFRPKLIESLLPYAEMEHAGLSGPGPGPAAARDAVRRLDAAVARLGDDMSAIRPGDWKRYNAKLRGLCGSPAFLARSFQQRLWKVMDVMYVDEETSTMESGDWGRLETVAKIVATVCEAMGPPGEGAGEVSRRWFCSKVQDIRFLKRIMTSINRKTRVLREGEGEGEGEDY